MDRVIHIIGNGDQAQLYNVVTQWTGNVKSAENQTKSDGRLQNNRKGLKLTCNLPPFPVRDAYASCIVDFKMMMAIAKGEIDVPGEWVLGWRPKIFMEKNPMFHMKRAGQIKEFFTKKPDYVANYTDFNCGHMATYYALNKFNPTEINLYGFDSIFDMNLRSSSDFYMNSDRNAPQNVKLNGNWRPIWQSMFAQFRNVNFVLHHIHDNVKFPVGENVNIKVYARPQMNLVQIPKK